MAQLVNKYLDEIDILKIKMENDADKILEVIDIDELLKNPSLYLQELGRAFLDEHQQEIKVAFKEGIKYAEKVVDEI